MKVFTIAFLTAVIAAGAYGSLSPETSETQFDGLAWHASSLRVVVGLDPACDDLCQARKSVAMAEKAAFNAQAFALANNHALQSLKTAQDTAASANKALGVATKNLAAKKAAVLTALQARNMATVKEDIDYAKTAL